MKIETFERVVYDKRYFTVSEMEGLELMNDDELLEYQRELEMDGGNLSQWDHLRALYTLKATVIDLLEVTMNKTGDEK